MEPFASAGQPRLFFGPPIKHCLAKAPHSSAKRRVLAILAVLVLELGSPGAARADNAVIERYVEEALGANRALGQQSLQEAKSAEAIKKAWGGFLPTVGLEARYSVVSGNALDLGQLVNPAYGALNQLLGQATFPTDIDARLPLTQETKLRITQPLFVLELLRNLELQESLGEVASAGLAQARRALAAEVRKAYLEWAKVGRVVELYDQTLAVLDESRRTTLALVDAGKLNDDALLRIEAERSEVEQKRVEAQRDRLLVSELLNFLRAAPLDSPLELSTDSVLPKGALPTLAEAESGALQREELRALSGGIHAQVAVEKLAQARYFPTLAVAVDYGVQGMEYRFTPEDDLLVVSFIASWNLFRGFQDERDQAQAALELERLSLRQQEVSAQLSLEARQAFRALETTEVALRAAQARQAAAQRAFGMVNTRYGLGAATQLDFIDARTRLTTAEINLTLTEYDRQLCWVELIRVAALEGPSS